jgi:hypothetical protein
MSDQNVSDYIFSQKSVHFKSRIIVTYNSKIVHFTSQYYQNLCIEIFPCSVSNDVSQPKAMMCCCEIINLEHISKNIITLPKQGANKVGSFHGVEKTKWHK